MMRIRRGQTILEYTMIVGIATLVLYYMGTGFKRGVQSMVKITADQVGNQANSDQDYNDAIAGHMAFSSTVTNDVHNKLVSVQNNLITTNDSDTTSTLANVYTNGGFNPSGE